MRVTKIYDDGRLVSCKKTGKDPLGQVEGRCLAALGKEFSYEMHAFLLDVSALQKELKTTKRLLLSRTKERDSVKKGHRQRLAQVYSFRERIAKAKLEYLILQEDLSAVKQRASLPDLPDADLVGLLAPCVHDPDQGSDGHTNSKTECQPLGICSTVNSKRLPPPPMEVRPSQSENPDEDSEECLYTFSIKASAKKG